MSLSIVCPGLPLSTSVVADASGTFAYTLAVPAHTAGGDYTIVAWSDRAPSGAGFCAWATSCFTPTMRCCRHGIGCHVVGNWFSPNETISISNDKHEDLFDDFSVTADERGAISVSRTLSGSTGDGYVTLAHARGQSSGVQIDRPMRKLSARASSMLSVAGLSTSSTLSIFGFAPSGSVHLSSSPTGLFTEQDVSVGAGGAASRALTINTSAPAQTYTILATDNAGAGYTARVTYVVEAAAAGNAVLRGYGAHLRRVRR